MNEVVVGKMYIYATARRVNYCVRILKQYFIFVKPHF